MIAYCMAISSTFLLIGCGESDNVSNATPMKKQEGKSNMKRHKTASNLEYEIIHEGSGVSPQTGQQVTVHYTGWLDVNGQPGAKFDSSVDRGQPFTFIIGIGQVIRGWDEGVKSMKVGEERRLYIPAELGYGARGAGRLIPPHSALIFDVKLLGVR